VHVFNESKPQPPNQILCEALDEHDIKDTSLMNFVVSDGLTMAATRYVRNPLSQVMIL